MSMMACTCRRVFPGRLWGKISFDKCMTSQLAHEEEERKRAEEEERKRAEAKVRHCHNLLWFCVGPE